MDDLDVIRLAVVDNITWERIARAGMEVKGNFGEAGGSVQNGLPDPTTRFTPVQRYSFAGETPVSLEECGGRGFRVLWTCPEGGKSRAFERFGTLLQKE
jgi:hypothetical protein